MFFKTYNEYLFIQKNLLFILVKLVSYGKIGDKVMDIFKTLSVEI